ncbi:MAG: glycosyltransferase family 39 protein [Myxococcota bacterium]
MKEGRKFFWSEGWGLAGVLLVALAIRAFAWTQTAVLFNDGPIFLALAEAIGEGNWAAVLAHPYHSLYPALIALVATFGVELEAAAIAVSIGGGLTAVAALYWFVRDFFGREEAWLAAWILALHPWAVDFSSDVMSDGLYLGVFMVAFACLVRLVDRPTVKRALACGVSCGLAYLARPEGGGLLLVSAGLLALRGFRDRRSLRALGVPMIALFFAGLIVIGPYVFGVSRVTGEWTVTQKKSISKLLADPSRPEIVLERDRERVRLERVGEVLPLPESAIRIDGPGAKRPDRSGFGVFDAILRVETTALSAFRWELMLLALIGVFAGRSNRNTHRDRAIMLVMACYFGLLVLLVWGEGYVSRRHALPPFLPLIGYSAVGLKVLWLMGTERLLGTESAWPFRLRESRILGMTVLVSLVLGWGIRDLRPRRHDRVPVRAAAEWLAVHRPGAGPVAAQKLRVAYYAGAKFVPLLAGDDGRLEAQLRERGARWVVIDHSKLADHQGLSEGIGDWLRVVQTSAVEGREALVLSIEPPAAPH